MEPPFKMITWYLIYTKPKHEDLISKRFSDIGIEVFNPKLKERRFIRRKSQEVISPLFPCYIFIKLNILNDYQLVKYTRGVKRFVGSEHLPTVVPDDVILSIKDRMTDGIITINPIKFKPGEEVVVKGGLFQGFDAIFENELNGSKRISILLKLINARLIVDSAMIEKR